MREMAASNSARLRGTISSEVRIGCWPRSGTSCEGPVCGAWGIRQNQRAHPERERPSCVDGSVDVRLAFASEFDQPQPTVADRDARNRAVVGAEADQAVV